MSIANSQGKDSARTILVTGGSRGIGKAIVLNFAKESVDNNLKTNIIINYANSDKAANEVLTEVNSLNSEFVSASLAKFNIGKSEDIELAFKEIKQKFGRLDVLVNNAGVTLNQLALRTKEDDWRWVIDTNLTGAFLCSRSALKLLLKSPSGRIINVSSVVAQMGNPGQSAYVASKAGIEGLTRSLAKELGSRKVTVNAVAPGFISTDMTNELDSGQKDSYLSNIPLARFGEADEVASVCVFLASKAAGYITGQVIPVNGGMYL